MPLNFYELYNLLNENTVSQELKNLKKNFPRLGEDIIEAKKELKAAFLHLDIADKSLEALAKWMMLLLTKSNWNRISDLTNVVIKLKNDFNDFLAYSLAPDKNFNANLLNKFNNPAFKYQDLMALSYQYHQELKSGKLKMPGREGKNILNFPDGFKWIDIEKGSCEVEGKSMGHCGNAGAKDDDTILSLRDSKNIPHLTFILNNGMLVERKGRANTKPKEKYHYYIIELLKLPIIKGLGPGRYLPENDFQLTDLKKEELEGLIKFKPKMENSYYLNMMLNGKKISQENIKKIIQDTNSEIDNGILNRKDVSEETIKLLFDKYKNSPLPENIDTFKEIPRMIWMIASHPKTNSSILRELYEKYKEKYEDHPDINDIIAMIAGNRNTEKSILIELFEKYYPKSDSSLTASELINSIASNPNTPSEILIKIFKEDKSSDWSYFLSINHNTPKEILIDMFKKGRDSVLSNSNVPEEILRMVVNSERNPFPPAIRPRNKDIQTKRLELVAMNNNCPSDILDQLSKDQDYDVRERVVYNKNTSLETLEKMANDPNIVKR